MWLRRYRIKAVTLLESLLVLFLVSLLALSLSGTVHGTFQRVEESLFFMGFEHLYQDSQSLSVSQQAPVRLVYQSGQLTNGYQSLAVPDGIDVMTDLDLAFSDTGGNSSLKKLVFHTATEQVTYQLYIGSGRYKKTVKSLHSP